MQIFNKKSLYCYSMLTVMAALHVPSVPGKANEAQTPGDGFFCQSHDTEQGCESSSGKSYSDWNGIQNWRTGMKLTID